jgi:lipopolysaccharide transport system ATP-binding protein
MSSGDLAISVRNLTKQYTIAHDTAQHSTLAEALLHRFRHPFTSREDRETFTALDDVSFDVQKGDVIGVIGRNGAGKSTLLKILSKIAEPTSGEACLYGRVGSLLEVGTGFHPELTGRENIFLNGAILGMRRAEIKKHFDAIVDFAGVEKFLDTPVKRYSSGMYVRLAFAVAAHLDCEIMVVDEVLAVGDQEFQNKCLGKMKDVSNSGRTVLFVSHNMQAVSLLCTKGLFFRRGQLTYNGTAQGAIDQYLQSFQRASDRAARPDIRPGTGEYRFTVAETSKAHYLPDEPKEVKFRIERFRNNVGRMYLSAHVVNEMGAVIAQCDSRLVGHWVDDTDAVEGKFTIATPWLKPGTYRVDLYICCIGLVDCFEDACTLNVSPVLPYPNAATADGTQHCIVLSDFNWETEHAAPTPKSLTVPALVG